MGVSGQPQPQPERMRVAPGSCRVKFEYGIHGEVEAGYVGPMKNGKPHGKGMATRDIKSYHLYGAKWEGNWVNGSMEGQFELYNTDRKYYYIQFKNNKSVSGTMKPK